MANLTKGKTAKKVVAEKAKSEQPADVFKMVTDALKAKVSATETEQMVTKSAEPEPQLKKPAKQVKSQPESWAQVIAQDDLSDTQGAELLLKALGDNRDLKRYRAYREVVVLNSDEYGEIKLRAVHRRDNTFLIGLIDAHGNTFHESEDCDEDQFEELWKEWVEAVTT